MEKYGHKKLATEQTTQKMDERQTQNGESERATEIDREIEQNATIYCVRYFPSLHRLFSVSHLK